MIQRFARGLASVASALILTLCTAVYAEEETVPGFESAELFGLGDPAASLRIIEYASLTCIHCKRFHTETFGQLRRDYIDTGKVYFIFQEFPLDGLALAAGQLSRCVAGYENGSYENFDPQLYHNMISTLYDQFDNWTAVSSIEEGVEKLAPLMQVAGLAEEQIYECLADDQLAQNIIQIRARGAEFYEISATPTLIIEGEKYEGALSYEALQEIIEDELSAPE